MKVNDEVWEYVENIVLNDWGGDVYNVVFTNDIQSTVRYQCDRCKIPSKKFLPGNNCLGCFINTGDKYGRRMWILLDIEKVSERVIVHECFHAIYYLLDTKGVKLKPSSEETFAYLLDSLYTRVRRVMKTAEVEYKKYKKENNGKSENRG